MRKPRSDARLKTLPLPQQQQIIAWLCSVSRAETLRLAQTQFGVQTSATALTPTDDPIGEWPLPWLVHEFGLRRGRDIYYTEGCGLKKALAPADMPVLYQMWDALLYLSGGEGFGLPAWEAMCCGLPVVYTDYSSHAEFLGLANAGLPVDGILQPEAGSCIFRMIADVPQAIEAVRRLCFDRQLGKALGANGRAFVQNYTPEIQAEKWHRIFQRLLHPTA